MAIKGLSRDDILLFFWVDGKEQLERVTEPYIWYALGRGCFGGGYYELFNLPPRLSHYTPAAKWDRPLRLCLGCPHYTKKKAESSLQP
jgi:hypothetical protein